MNDNLKNLVIGQPTPGKNPPQRPQNQILNQFYYNKGWYPFEIKNGKIMCIPFPDKLCDHNSKEANWFSNQIHGNKFPFNIEYIIDLTNFLSL